MATVYTIKDIDGTIHTFKTLKAAKASTIGFSFYGGLRIINHVKLAAKKRPAAATITATN
jgi:hypothetical protein